DLRGPVVEGIRHRGSLDRRGEPAPAVDQLAAGGVELAVGTVLGRMELGSVLAHAASIPRTGPHIARRAGVQGLSATLRYANIRSMRWDEQRVERESGRSLPGLDVERVRTFDAPEALGISFHEVRAKSALNRVPGDYLPFDWTVNAFRGCTHACTYCFARNTHTYLDLNAGRDFEREIVVKVTVPELLRPD